MNKKILFTLIAFTGIGIINAVIFLILSSLNIVSPNTIQSTLLICLHFLVIWIPLFITLIFKINFKLPIIIAYEIFIIFALVVGSLWGVYEMGSLYDKIVHFGSGVLFALLAYNMLAETKGVHLNPIWTFITIFSFAMMIGGVWEICEFSFDTFFGENAQHWMEFEGHEVLLDTMLDLICDCCGGICGGISVILFRKNHKTKQAVIEKQ
jgi:hypothetical protein